MPEVLILSYNSIFSLKIQPDNASALSYAIEEAREEAKAEGKYENAVEMAVKLKARNMQLEEIAEITGLTIDEIDPQGEHDFIRKMFLK